MNGLKIGRAAIVLICAALLLGACAKDPEKAKTKYLAIGNDYLSKGNYGDAAIEFRNAVRVDPRFVDAYLQLSRASFAQHDWKTSYTALQKAIEIDPNRLDARLALGNAYLIARQFDKAEAEADFILTKNPKDSSAYQLLGSAFLEEKRTDEALTTFVKESELSPNQAGPYINRAIVEIGLRRFEDAEQHLKRAIEVDPKALSAYSDLANVYRLQNRGLEAEQVWEESIAKNPDESLVYVDFASMLFAEGKKPEADDVLDRLRMQLPNSDRVATTIGDFYFQRKQNERAISEYRRGLSLSPKNLEIQKRILDGYLSTGQIQLAADVDRELTKDAATDIVVRLNHGRLLMAQRKFVDATVYLQKVVADAANSPQAHYFLGMAFWQNGELGQANTAFQDALKVSPGFPAALQALARLSLVQASPSTAQNYAQELVQKFPADPVNRQLLAEALARQGQLRPAEEQLLTAKKLAPGDALVHLNLAQVYSAEKKSPDAQSEFDSALQLDPHNTTILGQFSDFLVARDQSTQALAIIQQYVSANPADENGYFVLGSLYLELKNYASAQEQLEHAIQINPKHEQAYVRLGEAYQAEKQIDLAITRYQKALDLQPTLAPLATMLGNLYLDKQDMVTARKYYVQALASDPNFAIANANMAWIDAQEDKDLDVALGMAQKAKSSMPEVPSITDTLGWVMYKRGNYASALPLLEDCVQKSPKVAEYHYHLGMTLLATGQKAMGKEQLKSALVMNLRTADAQLAQQTLVQVN